MTSPCETQLEMHTDPEALSRRVADWMLEVATTKDGAFTVALSGGSTPRRLYQLLAGLPYCDKFPWSRSHWFWGDERFVSHDDTLSNYRMVRADSGDQHSSDSYRRNRSRQSGGRL
jgi:6-phosphogluconolactonase